MRTPSHRALVLAAAACSGAATLVYEVVWMRVLAVSVGATWPALTVVLAGMMLGLGLGAVLGGWLVDRGLHPGRGIVAVELLVMLLAGAFPWVAIFIGNLDLAAVGVVPGRALLAGLAMMPATTLMGTTLPLMSAALHRGDAGATHLPGLYAVNTLGACLGALAGGLWLPFVVGVQGSLVVAGVLNLGAAALALGLARRPFAPPATSAAPPLPLQGRVASLLLLAFGSGAAVMLAELLWTRSLLQVPGRAFQGLAVEHADVMALVLVFVLLGSGLGGVLAARGRAWSGERIARVLALTWGLGGLLVLTGVEGIAVHLGAGLLLGPQSWLYLALRLGLVALPAMLLGVGFPLLGRLLSGALQGHGRRLGRAWLANTVGGVLGSVLGGWWVLPRLGAATGLIVAAGLSLAMAAVAAGLAGGRRLGWALAGAGVVGGALLLLPLQPGQVLARVEGMTVLAAWEGWEATTLVAQRPDGSRVVASNGRWIPGEARYRYGGATTLETLSQLTSRPPRKLLLIGFGTGLFAQGLLDGMEGGELTIVEIDGAQLTAAEHFGTQTVLGDPRVTLVVDDALHFLDRTELRYDLVMVDSWGPEASPALYSLQFHQRAAAHLAAGGVVWAKLAGLGPESLSAVTDAVRSAYPVAALHVSDAREPLGLVGADRRLPPFGHLELLEPCGGDCAPLDLMWPQRLH